MSQVRDDFLRSVGEQLPRGIQEKLLGTPLYDAYLRIRAKTVPLSDVTFETESGPVNLSVHPDSEYARKASDGSIHEPGLTGSLLQALDEGETFYDVGAHYGYVSELARIAGVEESHIHSFEGDLFNHSILVRNTHDTEIRTVRRFVGTDDHQLSIDEYQCDHPAPSVVKIDVEGAEYDVLRSMESCLRHHDLSVYAEIHPGYLPEFEGTVEKIQSFLEAMKYDFLIRRHRSDEGGWNSVLELPDDDGYLLWAFPAKTPTREGSLRGG